MKTILFIACSLCICHCATAQLLTAPFMPDSNSIDSLLRSMYRDSLPGVSLGIVYNGQEVFQKNYGVVNIATQEKIKATSDFNIASLTKQFTAIAILQFEEQHKLSLTDKISRFFPDMNKKVADVITIRELLTHSSGIIDHYDQADTRNLKHAHNIDVYNAIKTADSTYFVPGTQFRYSNTAYCLLALVIEKISGRSYNTYMQQNVFKPAGMLHTIIWNEKAVITNEVTGYERDSASAKFSVSGPNEHIFFSTEGDGGVYTSVNDYIKWYKALQSGKVFSKNITGKARTIEYAISKESKVGYGFGWFVEENDAARKVYHSGSNDGFRSFSFSMPSAGYLVIIFSNRDDIDLQTLAQKIVQLQWPAGKPFIMIEKLTS
ncbi:MAG: serine hydrolase domain-containing protein [Ginsengibacter sp.]